MPDARSEAHNRQDWDEHDWERFLQCADTRAAKYQELFETLLDNPARDQLIAREMGWEKALAECGENRDCGDCGKRFECEVYGMLCLVAEPERIESDPDAEALNTCFEELNHIPAYCRAHEFAGAIEKTLRKRFAEPAAEEAQDALSAARMVPAQIAGGHGIGYEKDSLCGNIANCKRALRNLTACMAQLKALEANRLLTPSEAGCLSDQAQSAAAEISRWIEDLRGRVWWR